MRRILYPNIKRALEKQRDKSEYIENVISELQRVGHIDLLPTNTPKKRTNAPIQKFVLTLPKDYTRKPNSPMVSKMIAALFKKYGWRASVLDDSFSQNIYMSKNINGYSANVIIVSIDVDRRSIYLIGKIQNYYS